MRKVLLVCTMGLWTVCAMCTDFVWHSSEKPAGYWLDTSDEEVISTALEMFCNDLTLVTGTAPQQVAEKEANIYILTIDGSKKQKRWLTKNGIDVTKTDGKWEAFHLQTIKLNKKNVLVVVGSDARGTAYGILELSRLAGVSPWCWWADVTPKKQTQLTVSQGLVTEQAPSVKYRGIFVNDEDFGMMPWSSQTFEKNGTKGLIGAQTYAKVCELLLRLRANMLLPAMHGCSVPFYQVQQAKETALKYGIVMATSHCEPLMRNNVTEWDEKRYGKYNYITNRDSVLSYWSERLKEVGDLENIYTMGMRGIHDSNMEGVKTLNEKTEALQRVINDQRALIGKYVNKKVNEVPQMFVPYKEVLEILDNGLEVPDDVTLIWCDDNYGYLSRLSNAEQQQRKGGSGVYYHVSYWGRPHDYLWLSTTQPGLIYSEMKRAYDTGADRVWILNVGDIKPAEYDIEFFMDMAWDIKSISPYTIYPHLKKWLAREFGDAYTEPLFDVMKKYYWLASIRKPEFMGWCQTEVDGYPRRLTPLQDTEFNPYELDNEVEQRLESYRAIKDSVEKIEKSISPERKEAFFQLIKYPVCAAEAMNRKILYAQMARDYAAKGWLEAKEYCELSTTAYNDIINLTNYYNKEMSGGKWNRMMSLAPRNLYVFNPPYLPNTDSLIAHKKEIPSPADSLQYSYVAFSAMQYDAASLGVTFIQGLGHSMSAIMLHKGATVGYEIETDNSGEAELHVALIPTHSSTGGELRYSIAIDNEEAQIVSIKTVGRSEQWKKNVLRGQALHTTLHNITKKGKHVITITALDDEIFVDQLMLDFKKGRKFYTIPSCFSCI